MSLKESLKKLQADEKISVKREVKKELTKIKKEKSRKKNVSCAMIQAHIISKALMITIARIVLKNCSAG